MPACAISNLRSNRLHRQEYNLQLSYQPLLSRSSRCSRCFYFPSQLLPPTYITCYRFQLPSDAEMRCQWRGKSRTGMPDRRKFISSFLFSCCLFIYPFTLLFVYPFIRSSFYLPCVLPPVSDRSPAQDPGRVVRFWNVENSKRNWRGAPRSRVCSGVARDAVEGSGLCGPSGRQVGTGECCRDIFYCVFTLFLEGGGCDGEEGSSYVER